MDISYYKEKYEPIDGKWYLSRVLGRGAYGTVFEAETKDYGKMKSAIKIISIPASASEAAAYKEEHFSVDDKSVSSYFYGIVEEYLKEIALMAKLKGKSNIVFIEDYSLKEHKDSIGWDIIIRMELLTPLTKHFAGKTITEKDVIKLGIDICKALEECENQNIIHRDIKPSNIFVSDNGQYKLGDFGVARTLEKTTSGFSKKGTYTYMAPEVYKGEDDYDSTVDTYSLGIVMYKLLNNNYEPFRRQLTANDEESALKSRMKNEYMPNPTNASEKVARIILKACKFNAKERYRSAHDMRLELEKIDTDDMSYIDKQEGQPFYITNEEEAPTEGIFTPKKEQAVQEAPKKIKKEHKKITLFMTLGILSCILIIFAGIFFSCTGTLDFITDKNMVIGYIQGFCGDYSVIGSSEKYGVVNKKGEYVIPKEYDYIWQTNENLFEVQMDGKIAIYDSGNNVIVPFGKYDGVGNGSSGHDDAAAEDRIVVRKNAMYGFIDYSGNEIVEPIYQDAKIYSEGLCAVMNIENGKWGYIDKTGNVVIPFVYEDAKSFSSGLAPVKNTDGKYGYIDKEGNTAIPFVYTNAESFSEDVGRVADYTEWGEMWGYISSDGNMITDIEFSSVGEFSDGLSAAIKYPVSGYVKKDGTQLTDFRYAKTYKFNNGVAIVEKKSEDSNTGYAGYDYINTNGRSIVPEGYEAIGNSNVEKTDVGLFPVRKSNGNKCGYIDKDGNVVIEAVYDDAEEFREGIARVRKDGKVYYINQKEEILFYNESR